MPGHDVLMELLMDGIDEAFDRKSWHGTNLRGALRSVAADEAAWRPSLGRHSIAEIALHAAYWKYAVRRLLTGGKRGSFALKGSNWFRHDDDLPAEQWRKALKLLDDEHRQLRDAVATFDPARLDELTPKRAFTYAGLIRGAAAHDLYHAGQIQLLKRLHRG